MRHDAIRSLYPQAVTINGDFEVWDKDGNVIKIDDTKVKEEEKRLLEKNKYIILRRTAYPTLEDQMDTLYHEGYDGWKKQIQAIKEKYPKSS